MTSSAASQRFAEQDYAKLRASLIRWFRADGLPDPENLADETVQRLLVHLENGEEIRSIDAYARRIADHVGKEERRNLKRARSLVSIEVQSQPATRDSEAAVQCLARCMEQLNAEERKLLLDYYSMDGRRKIERHKGMAKKLGVSADALSMRILRLRQRLRKCIADCRKTSS